MARLNKAYRNESLVLQGVERYVELVFKSGFDIVSKSPENLSIIKKFFSSFARTSEWTLRGLLESASYDLVVFSNAFWVKSRERKRFRMASDGAGKLLMQAGTVNGYFPVPPYQMSIAADENGNVTGYMQRNEAGATYFYMPLDVIHFKYRKPTGELFGLPFLFPVLEDAITLRESEEDTIRKNHLWASPIMDVTVGTEQFPGQPDEVDAAKDEIEGMDVKGGLAHTERMDVDIIKTEAMNTNQDMQYFRERVMMGMGLSPLEYGLPSAASRSLGESMALRTRDRVCAYQRVIEDTVNYKIFIELLEDAVGTDISDDIDDEVMLRFKEINTAENRAQENHTVYKYEHNAITEDQMRVALGHEPITDGERDGMYVNKVAKQLAAMKAETSSEPGDTDNKNQPSNQHGKRASADPARGKEGKASDLAWTVCASLGETFKIYDKALLGKEISYNRDAVIDGVVEDVLFAHPELNDEVLLENLAELWVGASEKTAESQAAEARSKIKIEIESANIEMIAEYKDLNTTEFKEKLEKRAEKIVAHIAEIYRNSILGSEDISGSVHSRVKEDIMGLLKN
jgi:hypothetical protein